MIRYRFTLNKHNSRKLKSLFSWIGQYWFQLILLVFIFHFYQSLNVQLVISPHETKSLIHQTEQFSIVPTSTSKMIESNEGMSSKFNEDEAYVVDDKWKSSDFHNLSFILNPSIAKRKGVSPEIVAEKLKNCNAYVSRFSKTAVDEQARYHIPASIKLAQGLLETNAGCSRLANESNNHFGIKCRSKCRGCTCRNYADDDVYDMFRVFESDWESYREHSKLLQISRYKHLKKLGTKDYKGWAIELKKAGYATDKNYHKKLIRIIEVLELHRFDQ